MHPFAIRLQIDSRCHLVHLGKYDTLKITFPKTDMIIFPIARCCQEANPDFKAFSLACITTPRLFVEQNFSDSKNVKQNISYS